VKAEERPPVPRILFNSDGGAAAFYRFQPSTIAAGLTALIDDLADTQVDVFIQCINHSDDQFYYPSRVAEYYGQHHEGEFLERERGFKRAADNIRALVDAGQDPLAIWADQAHQREMQFWASLRMNDVHKDHTDIWPSLRSRWEKQNKVRIGDDLPEHYKDQRLSYSWAMDYGLQEVRDHKLAIIEELCRDYDVDGFEMDFQRAPYFFRNGERDRVQPLMTQFVRRVRQRLDEIGKTKKREIVLAARVPQTLARADLVGLDVRTWIKEGLVDYVIPMHTGYLDMNAEVASYVEIARGTNCKVYGGLEMSVKDYAGRATLEMLRAAASGYYEEGAAGIYLFNYDAHSPRLPFLPEHKQALQEIGSRQGLVGKDKHYFITRDMRGHTAQETAPPLHKVGGEMQLPATLPAGQPTQFHFTVGDDLDAAREAGTLAALELRIRLQEYPPSHRMTVRLNGELAGKSAISGAKFVFTDPPARQGRNVLTVTQRNPNSTTLRMERVELIVKYGTHDGS